MIKLVAIDLDGTFYAGHARGVPASAWEAIERGKKAGLKFAVCTGRPVGGFGLEYAREIQPDGLHVFNDGASVLQSDGTPVHSVMMPGSKEMVQFSRSLELPLELCSSHSRYYEQAMVGLEEHIAFTGISSVEHDLMRVIDRETVVKAWFVVQHRELWLKHRETVCSLPDLVFSEYYTEHNGVTVTGVNKAGISKSTGLQFLAEDYGIPLEEIAMIGDGDNDIEALKAAGLGIAMGNGNEQVKAAANHIVGDVRNDGFAEAVDLILNQ